MIVVLYGFLIFSIFASISAVFAGGGGSPFGSFLSFGVISIAFIGLGFLSLIGFILFIVSMYQFSHYYKEPGIFKNIVYSLVVGIAGAGTLVVILLVAIFSSITISRLNTSATSPAPGLFFIGFFAIICAALVIGLVSALFCKRAFNQLGEKSGISSFDTAGLLILIGVIIPFISWIGWIFAALGFNSLKTRPAETYYAYNISTAPMVKPATTQNKYCPFCGTANNLDSSYCKNCGNKLL